VPLAIALTDADVSLRAVLVHLQDRGLKPHLDQVQNRPVTNAFGDHGQEVGMGDGVEILGKIGIDDFGMAGAQGIRYIIDCVMG
jgi:hypothetical protein